MIEEKWTLSDREWDHWRGDPLTKQCLSILLGHAEARYGEILRIESEENYGDLFADPARQARYASLRGRIEGVKDLMDTLELELGDLTDEIERSNAKDKP